MGAPPETWSRIRWQHRVRAAGLDAEHSTQEAHRLVPKARLYSWKRLRQRAARRLDLGDEEWGGVSTTRVCIGWAHLGTNGKISASIPELRHYRSSSRRGASPPRPGCHHIPGAARRHHRTVRRSCPPPPPVSRRTALQRRSVYVGLITGRLTLDVEAAGAEGPGSKCARLAVSPAGVRSLSTLTGDGSDDDDDGSAD